MIEFVVILAVWLVVSLVLFWIHGASIRSLDRDVYSLDDRLNAIESNLNAGKRSASISSPTRDRIEPKTEVLPAKPIIDDLSRIAVEANDRADFESRNAMREIRNRSEKAVYDGVDYVPVRPFKRPAESHLNESLSSDGQL